MNNKRVHKIVAALFIFCVCVSFILFYINKRFSVWDRSSGFDNRSIAETEPTVEKTSRGTPINRKFDLNSVSMINTSHSDCFQRTGTSLYISIS